MSCFSNQVSSESDNLEFLKIDISELYKNNNEIRVQLSIKIPTDKLVFQKSFDGFKSNLSISAIFMNDNSITRNESWDIEINKSFFEETKQNENVIIIKEVFIPKGKYNLNMIINDYENHISWIKDKEFELYDTFELSDILLFEKNGDKYIGITNEEIANLDTLWAQFYLEKSSSPIKLNYKFYNIGRNKGNKEIILEKNIEKIIESENVYYPIPIIHDFFNAIDIEIEYRKTNRVKSILLNRYQEIDYDYRILVGPMNYILENSDFKKLREYDNLTDDQKLEYVINYWKSNELDRMSELFVEFYNRVQYVNDNFPFLSYEGWESDRGKIYIIYGKPFDIKNEFTMEAEYEIWTYKSNKQFIFINKYGDYVLSTYN